MASLYTNQDSNIRKTWLLMTMFFVVVILVGWVIGIVMNNPLILYFAIFFSITMNFFSYWFSDKVVLKMSGAKPVAREDNKMLYNIVENLSITAGLPIPKIYIMDEMAPNAFATGRDKEHAAVAVTEGLLQILNKTELEGVIAHELSHIGNRDILISTIVVVLVGFVTLLSDFLLRWSLFGNGDNRGGGSVGTIMIIVGLVLAILAPIIAVIIQLAISRKREFLADASGALLTRYPDGLASALKKISASGAQMKRANHATAHMFIANPFKNKKSIGFLSKLFMTHPPTEERVTALIGR